MREKHTKILLAEARLFTDAGDSGALKSATNVAKSLASSSVRRDVEIDLPVLDPVLLDHFPNRLPTLLRLSLPFLRKRDLRIRSPRVHALIHVPFALAVPDQDYPARPRRRNFPGGEALLLRERSSGGVAIVGVGLARDAALDLGDSVA